MAFWVKIAPALLEGEEKETEGDRQREARGRSVMIVECKEKKETLQVQTCEQ